MNLFELTIDSFHLALLDKQVTCFELVAFYLDRIKRFDDQLLSIVAVNPSALEEAEKLDAQFLREGQLSGKLFSVPVLIKDNIQTIGLPTTAGSASLRNFEPPEDAVLVAKLKAAGAIILAKTNMHEFAISGETVSSILGQTRNPYDLTRTAGGSSGGTGAALAANFGLAGIGTDTINSVRSPASANSIVGIRPTLGRVSRAGIVPYSLTQDTAGPMCRTVSDAGRMLAVIQGFDPQDSATDVCQNDPVEAPAPSGMMSLAGIRIGVLRTFFGSEPVNAEVNRVMDTVLNDLRAAGADLVEIEEQIDSTDIVRNISMHLDDFQHDLDQYLAANKAPVSSMREVYEGGKFHPWITKDLEEALELSPHTQLYAQKMERHSGLKQWLADIFEQKSLAALVYPHQQQLTCKIGAHQLQRNGVLASVTGFPAICVPAGFSRPEPEAPLGVPVGVEFLGTPCQENRLLEIAYAYEQLSLERRAPQGFGLVTI